jgi:hypothetical protein
VLEAAVFEAADCELFHDDFYSRETKERDRVNPRQAARIKAELNRRYPDQVRQAAHDLFRGRIGLQQLLTDRRRQGGYRGPETINDSNWGEVAAYCVRAIYADGPSTCRCRTSRRTCRTSSCCRATCSPSRPGARSAPSAA